MWAYITFMTLCFCELINFSFPQLIPGISSLSWFTTIVPLVMVLVITAVKDATDDYVSATVHFAQLLLTHLCPQMKFRISFCGIVPSEQI